jgi:acetyl esterase/lipase
MMRGMKQWITLCVVLTASLAMAAEPAYTRKQDVIYGRYPGVALTMDVFTPKENAKGIAVLAMVSGGWSSSRDAIDNPFFASYMDVLTRRGYTVFAVVHGSQPKFQIPEILPMISRAVRYVRHNAREFGIDPDRIGITGGSAGGHLSLMQGCAPVPPDENSKDPVDRVSAKVQAVACFFPPTDFLNYGKPDHVALGRGELSWLRGPFLFSELDPKTSSYQVIDDEAKIREIGKRISPVNFVTADDAPALIVHGDADKLVPIQQAEVMIAAMTKANVPCKLVTKPGLAHGWLDAGKDVETFADWFDEHLANKPASPAPTTEPK